jgi:hypothetical protein
VVGMEGERALYSSVDVEVVSSLMANEGTGSVVERPGDLAVELRIFPSAYSRRRRSHHSRKSRVEVSTKKKP